MRHYGSSQYPHCHFRNRDFKWGTIPEMRYAYTKILIVTRYLLLVVILLVVPSICLRYALVVPSF